MDPKAALIALLECFAAEQFDEHERQDAIDNLAALKNWLEAGGFSPAVDDVLWE